MNRSYVLVVDDDDEIRDLTAQFIESEGVQAFGAANGLEALKTIGARGEPGLILLDLRMPVLNGEEFLARLSAIPGLRQVPVIVVTGDRSAEAAAAKLGAHGGLSKPFELDTLLSIIHRYVGMGSSGAGSPAPP